MPSRHGATVPYALFHILEKAAPDIVDWLTRTGFNPEQINPEGKSVSDEAITKLRVLRVLDVYKRNKQTPKSARFISALYKIAPEEARIWEDSDLEAWSENVRKILAAGVQSTKARSAMEHFLLRSQVLQGSPSASKPKML